MSATLRRTWLLAALVASCATTESSTQPTHTTPAADPDNTVLVDGDVTVGRVNGIQVIVKRVPGAELAAGRLVIRGGVRNWTADTAGIEELAIATATTGGTEKLDKDAFARKLASMGSELAGAAHNDFSVLAIKSLNAHWDETFSLLVDAFLHPALPASEVELNRQRQLAMLKHEQEDPDGRLELLVHRTIFAGHPYANRAVGTLATVGAIKPEQLGPALQKLREASRLIVVAVGDLNPDHVFDQVRAAFGTLPKGSYVETELPPVHFDQAHLTVESDKLPTNYIEAAFPAPKWRDPDFAVAAVSINHLAERLFEEVRTKRNLSYAPGAHLVRGSGVPLASLYVTAVDPNTTLKVMYDQVRLLQTKPITTKELAAAQSTYLTGQLFEAESMDGQARLLSDAQIFGGDWKRVRELPDQIRAVTPAQVQAFAQKVLAHGQVEMVGDASKLDPALAQSL